MVSPNVDGTEVLRIVTTLCHPTIIYELLYCHLFVL